MTQWSEHHLRAARAAAEAVSDLLLLGSPSSSPRPALAASPVATPLAAPHLTHRALLSAICRLALMPACRFSHAMLASCHHCTTSLSLSDDHTVNTLHRLITALKCTHTEGLHKTMPLLHACGLFGKES